MQKSCNALVLKNNQSQNQQNSKSILPFKRKKNPKLLTYAAGFTHVDILNFFRKKLTLKHGNQTEHYHFLYFECWGILLIFEMSFVRLLSKVANLRVDDAYYTTVGMCANIQINERRRASQDDTSRNELYFTIFSQRYSLEKYFYYSLRFIIFSEVVTAAVFFSQ